MAHPTYTIDEAVVPSVTQVIRRNLGWDKEGLLGWYRNSMMGGIDPITVRDNAGFFGTYVHACLEKNRINPKVDDEVVKALSDVDRTAAHGVLAEYRKWAKRHNVKPALQEQSLTASIPYGFGGTIDLIGRVDGRERIIDYKTSRRIKPEHFIQLAGYQILWEEKTGTMLPVTLLHLKRSGPPHAYEYEADELIHEREVFRLLLSLEYERGRIHG